MELLYYYYNYCGCVCFTAFNGLIVGVFVFFLLLSVWVRLFSSFKSMWFSFFSDLFRHLRCV